VNTGCFPKGGKMDKGTEELNRQLQFLEHKNKDIREKAAIALGKLGDRRAVEPLIRALSTAKDTSPGAIAVEDLRYYAAKALGMIGDARATEPLITLRREDDLFAGIAAGKALCGLEHAAVPILLGYISDKKRDVREAVIDALGKIGDDSVIKPLVKARNDADDMTRLVIDLALGRLGDSRALEPLMNALWAHSMWRKDEVVEVLGILGDAEAVPALIRMLNYHEDGIGIKAAWSLGELEDERAIEPLRALVKEGRPGVGKAAAEVLEALGWNAGKED
jgi:HEAT repeat protein